MIRSLAFLLVALLLPVVASAAPAKVDKPATVEKTATVAVAEDRTAEDWQNEARQLESLLRGELPEKLALAQLFPLDLLDEPALKEQRVRIQAEIDALPAPVEGQASPKRRALELRLQILSSRPDLRKALVDADTRRLSAQRGLEQAEASRVQAEAEAVAAEEAKKKALEAADAARGAAEKFFATELAKVENTRLDLAKLKQQQAEQRVALRSGEIARQGEQIRIRIQHAPVNHPANRVLYEECVEVVVAARTALRRSLEAVDRKIEVPRYVPPPEFPGDASLIEERQRLQAATDSARTDAEALVADLRRLRHDQAAVNYERLTRLNRSRIELLHKLPKPDRDQILGLGQAGFDQFRRELEHLRLQFAWYRYARANLGFVWLSVTEDTPRLLKVIRDAVRFAVLCVIAVWVARRRERWLDRIGATIVRMSRGGYARRAALAALELVERVFPELLLVVVALLAPWALGRLAGIAEVVVVVELFLIFAIYRLLLKLAYLLILWLSVGGGALPPRLRQLTLKSLRLTGLYTLVTMFVLVLSEQALGRGYLHSLVVNIWWLGGLPIAAVLVRWWQSDIAEGYLRFREGGQMASLVRATRERWYGFFVTVAAVTVLIVVAAGRLAARFALEFDQTRKALAYLFRRRLERQAEDQGEQTQSELDDALLQVLSEDPAEKPELVISHFPGLETFLESTKKWSDGRSTESTLLVGDTGFGKTTWLLAAEKGLVEAGIKVHRVTPPAHVADAAALLAWLGPALKLPHDDRKAFSAALEKREREAVMIDDGHRLFSRSSFAAWDALCEVAGVSTSRVLWVVALARFPYDYLAWARDGLTAPFRRVFKLKPWSDNEIAELLRTRMQAAGYRVRYDDLVAERVEGVRQQNQLVRTETEYARLIWDYADGCPRTALRCWKASLQPAGRKTVSVRLFRRPDISVVLRLTTRERFILAALVWHQTLTAGMAARVLRFPESLCEDTLELLRDSRVVSADDGVYRLESDWLQPVRRLLRRENLIVN